jgi:hypothetical protein
MSPPSLVVVSVTVQLSCVGASVFSCWFWAWLRWPAEQQGAAAPLPCALSAPVARVGLPTSHVATQSDGCRKTRSTGIRTVLISDSAITLPDADETALTALATIRNRSVTNLSRTQHEDTVAVHPATT